MRLLLIRHGETVDNVAGKYAGITDSPLTTHGVLQTSRLGAHLAGSDFKVSHLFSSDLQRAFKTAEAIRLAQIDTSKTVTQLQLLREQDFGFYEGKQFFERPRGSDKNGREAHREANMHIEGFQDVESKQAMAARVESFLDGHLLPVLVQVGHADSVVIVAHGIILTHLWRGILARFDPQKVSVAAGVVTGGNGMGLEYLGGWSNTGYLDLEIKSQGLASTVPSTATRALSPVSPPPSEAEAKSKPGAFADITLSLQPDMIPDHVSSSGPQLPDGIAIDEDTPASDKLTGSPAVSSDPRKPLNLLLVVKAVNSQEHLKGLRKTRGGIGNAKHDNKQKTMDSFVKRRKLG